MKRSALAMTRWDVPFSGARVNLIELNLEYDIFVGSTCQFSVWRMPLRTLSTIKTIEKEKVTGPGGCKCGGGWREGGGGDEKRGDKSKKHLRKKFNRVVKHNALGVSLVIEAE